MSEKLEKKWQQDYLGKLLDSVNWKGKIDKKHLGRMAIISMAILLNASFAQADKVADKKLKFFHGTTPQTLAIELGWPTVELTRDKESDYPLQRVETVAGTLTVHGYNFYGSQHLLWNDKELTDAVVISPLIAYPEQQGKPAVIISKLLREEDFSKHHRDSAVIRIIDMGVSPPFISKDYLDIDFPVRKAAKEKKCLQGYACHPTAYVDAIKKMDADTYIIFGLSTEEKDSAGNPLPVTYKYSRKDRTVTRVK